MAGEKKVLENDSLMLEINADGAELTRIYDKKKKRDVLWEADPKVWGRHSPVLFPFVGRSFDNQYVHNGQVYPMGQHGFARDMVCSGGFRRNKKEISVPFLFSGRLPPGRQPDSCDVEGKKQGRIRHVFYGRRPSCIPRSGGKEHI